MNTQLIGKLFQGPKTEIGFFENDKISARVKVKIINSKLYACLYQEWMGSAKDPYFEHNFVGAYMKNNILKLLGLGTLDISENSSTAVLNIDFRHPFVDVTFPYLLIESPTITPPEITWERFIIP